jgi:hypothetical protein
MELYGLYRESTYSNNFEKEFDFETFNRINIEANTLSEPIVVFDPSYISKSEKHTYGVNKFYSGCSQRPEWGIGELAIVEIAIEVTQ